MLAWTEHDIGPDAIAESAVVGFAQTNCYVIGCSKTMVGAVIDPGTTEDGEAAAVIGRVRHHGLLVKYILNTHGHPDHFAGNDAVKTALGGDVMIHSLDALKLVDPDLNSSRLFGLDFTASPADGMLNDDDVIDVGRISLKVIHVPGHSCGGVALLGDGFVFTGDTLFAGSVGRTDLPGGCMTGEDPWEVLLQSITDRLFTLDPDVIVLPGHGPPTTIGIERRTNPFLL